MLVVLLLFAAAGVPPGHSQDRHARIAGQVLAADAGHPLGQAHVFVAASMMGTTTDAKGQFELAEVPAGAHRLVVSMVGYTPFEADSIFRAGMTYEFEVALEPTSVPLQEIVVSAREARRFQRRLIKFTRLFLSETRNSELTTILNPEVLTFTSRLGRLTATASAPLILANRALGYRLQYFLKEFSYAGGTIKWDGDPLFIPLEPADSAEAERWEANRQAAFLGSKRHFFLSLLNDRTGEEQFTIYRRYRLDGSSSAFLIDLETLLRRGPTPLEKELTFSGYLEIVYAGDREDEYYRRWQRVPPGGRRDYQRSFIRLNDGPTLIDQTGEVIDPYGITEYGYFAFERLSDLMPKEYRPPGWEPYESER